MKKLSFITLFTVLAGTLFADEVKVCAPYGQEGYSYMCTTDDMDPKEALGRLDQQLYYALYVIEGGDMEMVKRIIDDMIAFNAKADEADKFDILHMMQITVAGVIAQLDGEKAADLVNHFVELDYFDNEGKLANEDANIAKADENGLNSRGFRALMLINANADAGWKLEKSNSYGSNFFHELANERNIQLKEYLNENFHEDLGDFLYDLLGVANIEGDLPISINALNKEGKTPLDLAIENKDYEYAAWLFEYGAKKTTSTKDEL